jgi:hypothetical protein
MSVEEEKMETTSLASKRGTWKIARLHQQGGESF